MIGAEWVGDAIKSIDGFPVVLANELKHCILAHHGELEFGSPKKPALVEALALSFADNIDAKMETFRELLVMCLKTIQSGRATTGLWRQISAEQVCKKGGQY